MDYKEKYEQALDRARKIHNQTEFDYEKGMMEEIFPELKESEDEKIRKVLIDYFNRYKEQEECGINTFFEIPTDNILAWLEKQGNNLVKNGYIQQKDFAPKATMANRQLYNRAILEILSNYVEKYPDIRFGQMLCNLGIGPVFNEESRETYWNLNETINKKS